MITDARALRDQYLPNELVHRNDDMNSLSSHLSPIEHGFSGENTLVTGPSGSGKTTLAKYTLEMLERETLSVASGYTNCFSNSTTTGVLHSLLIDADLGHDLQRETSSRDQFLRRVRELEDQVVFIIDEVDALEDLGLLAPMFDAENVTLILICVNENGLLSHIDMRIQSRIRSAASMRLDKYRHQELVDIVDGRINAGLRPSAHDRAAIDRLAELAAGDARMAVAILRRAALKADREGIESLSPGLVESVVDGAESDVHQKNIERLSTEKRILYDIIEDHGEIAAEDLHERYEERSLDPRSKPTRRRYLATLERYDLVEQIGATRGSRYRHVA